MVWLGLIDLRDLFDRFAGHVVSCKSAEFVLNTEASFESWFRVELVPVLQSLGYSIDDIDTNYRYPDSWDKADLCVRAEGEIVFELKSFVKGQDANKKREYPKQIKKLERLVESEQCDQVIALTTFIGYSQQQMKNYLRRFFLNDKWTIIEPRKISKEGRLHLTLGTIGAGKD